MTRAVSKSDVAPKNSVDAQTLISKFVGAWNAETQGERRRLLEACCNQQTHFASTQGENTGLETQLEAIRVFRLHYPRAIFAASLLMEHHGWLLLSWAINFGDGRPILRGIDVGTLGDNGRLVRMISFSPIPTPWPQ